MPRPFQSELVLEERISEASLRAYHVGFDQNRFRLQPLVDVIRRVIPEFALGYHAGKTFPMEIMADKLKEAALTVFNTEKYKLRGEFGELILHLLLRDFCGTQPLVSKIYFKDSPNVPGHGFDGIHVTTDPRHKRLWLGESKLYADGLAGVRDLANDLKEHVAGDYLRREFSLISRKLPPDTPDIPYWLNLMDQHQTLDKIFSNIVVPMVCTYTSKLFVDHTAETQEYIHAFEAECRHLKKTFEAKFIKTSVEVILMLLPVNNKDELNSELYKRLRAMQGI